MPLNIDGKTFDRYDKNLKNEEINTSLFENLSRSNSII
jgi:hypothetical protein